MEIKKVKSQDGDYFCDIDVSIAEWKGIIMDHSLMRENYKDALIKFYNEPEHKSTCKALGDKYTISPQSINGTITAFAKAVQRKLNRFEVIDHNGNPTYWIIPMMGKDIENYFEWTMRPELVKAIEETNFIVQSNVSFKDMSDLVNIVNQSLGDFCDTFRYKRKGLASLERASSSGILFKYENSNRDWAINEGGETEIQYRLSYSNNTISYGLGFNTRYVLRKDEKSPIAYIKPFANGYIQIKDSELISNLKKQDFSFIIGDEKELRCLRPDEYYLFGKEIQTRNNTILLSEYMEMVTNLREDLFTLYCKIFEERNKMIESKNRDIDFVNFLRSNKNIILTGAPGTGKTYLAKQIALLMLFDNQNENELNDEEREVLKEHFCFVQFHPSYDYTDFVEGLRAEEMEGQVMFNLHNGTFKEFCKTAATAQGAKNISVLYDSFVEQIEEGEIKDIVLRSGGKSEKLSITPHHFNKNIHWHDKKNNSDSKNAITKQRLLKLYENFNSVEKLNSMKNIDEDIRAAIGSCNTSMYWAVLNHLLTQTIKKDDRPYICVIDEINRGEISKIFGELFFSIDPGYRGVKGKVKTQYANIQSNDTIYDYSLGKGWFYIPENVYIIGTMNDIDRSVESMDFAMRRRFAWKEIKSIDRISMWDGKIDDWKEEASKRMESLNKAIESVRGLSPAYHVGPAYFLKLENCQGDFEELWNNHLQSLLFEYVRGLPDMQEELQKLKNAYNLQQ